ncbi:hypothetical protein [Bacteroides pyogenes]|uniref:hypothetical protein n=1 Tax=Bacteroides pyogenes TaxID=310300 RepID=UPI001F45A673|nr:hypothetical protein [Bacteroides pyogenes]
MNIFYPINSNNVHSLEEYWDKKNEHLNKVQNWFQQENIPINPYFAFFHLAEQANLYLPAFKEDMQNLLKVKRECWIQVSSEKFKLSYGNMIFCSIADILENMFLVKCFKYRYNINNMPDYKSTHIVDIEQLFNKVTIIL